MKHYFHIGVLAALVFLGACAGREPPPQEVLTPIPAATFNDPDNDIFMRAVAEYIQAKDGPGNTRYEFTRLDLNHDGRREGIVLMKGPHQYWCGFNGCHMAIFKAHNENFELLSEVAPVRGPLTVSDRLTNGWRDIVVRVSGRSHAQTKDVALRFNGRAYPPQPAYQPPLHVASRPNSGVEIFP